jgi:hypothetical protein
MNREEAVKKYMNSLYTLNSARQALAEMQRHVDECAMKCVSAYKEIPIAETLYGLKEVDEDKDKMSKKKK